MYWNGYSIADGSNVNSCLIKTEVVLKYLETASAVFGGCSLMKTEVVLKSRKIACGNWL